LEGSSAEPRQSFGFYLLEWDRRCGVRSVRSQATVELLALGITEWRLVDFVCNALPDLLDQGNTVLNTEPIDPESSKRLSHRATKRKCL
jgi:hypothetical protein